MAYSCTRYYVVLCLMFLCAFATVNAQEEFNSFGAIEERHLVETRWKYAYTLHVESNTVLHQADANYEHYLYFRYNYSYQQYLNGVFSKGWWSLNDRTLDYSFQGVENFEIGNINKKTLILDFQRPNAKGHYQYHKPTPIDSYPARSDVFEALSKLHAAFLS